MNGDRPVGDPAATEEGKTRLTEAVRGKTLERAAVIEARAVKERETLITMLVEESRLDTRTVMHVMDHVDRYAAAM